MKLLAALLALCCSITSFAFDKPVAWSAATSPVFPVVRIFTCPNHFAAQFPGFTWSNIRGHALAVANQWFVQGNADVRLRVQNPDLAATDPRCSSGSGVAGTGEILLTAESNFGAAGVCRWGTTFGGPGSGSAKVILHRGCVDAAGTFNNLPWATDGGFPAAGQGDFWSVMLHEFGHALGFNHSPDATSVMFGSLIGTGDDSRRNLSRDEILGLQDPAAPYGPIQTTLLHRRESASNLGTWIDEGEPTNGPVFGAPAVDHSTKFNTASFYLMAFVRASDSALMWGRTNGVSNWASGFAAIPTTLSRHPPAVAGDAASPQEVLAYVNDSQTGEIVFRTNSTGTAWNSPTTLGSEVSHVGPALAYLSNRNMYVMAWPHDPTGRIRTAVSLDHGASFINVQEWSATRTYHRIGITCPAADQCLLAFSDGSKPYTQWSFLNLVFVPGAVPLFVPGSTGTLGQDSYGGGVGSSATLIQFGWRDRGTATLLTGAHRAINSNVNVVDFIPSVVHSAPSAAFDPGGSDFTLWSTFAPRYNQ